MQQRELPRRQQKNSTLLKRRLLDKTYLAVEEPKVGCCRLQRPGSHDLVVLRGRVDVTRVAGIGSRRVERVGQGSDQDLRAEHRVNSRVRASSKRPSQHSTLAGAESHLELPHSLPRHVDAFHRFHQLFLVRLVGHDSSVRIIIHSSQRLDLPCRRGRVR